MNRSSLFRLTLLFGLAGVFHADTGPQVAQAEEFACPGPVQSVDVRHEAVGVSWPYRVVLPGLAAGEAIPRPDAGLVALSDRLAAIVSDALTPGRFSVAVTDLQSGETVGVNIDRPQLAGCVMNLFAIVATLQAVDGGRIALVDVDATIRQTIWASDATAARELFRAAGGGDVVAGVAVVNALLKELGMTSSLVDHPPAFVHESIGINSDNWITSRDVNQALAQIYAGQVLSADLTAYLLEAMTHVKPGLNYLTAIVNGPALVSHKNGFLWTSEGFVDKDAAIVRFGPNLEHAYAITFLSEAVPVKYADIPTGQALVREVWEYFDETYD